MDKQLTMELSDSSVMLVLYADPAPGGGEQDLCLRYLDLSSNPVEMTKTLSVDLNKSGDTWTSDIWTVVVERPDTPVPEPES